ncbi:MAG: tRNA pseudouridine(38-40) synthase TruA [Thermodesulfobacteriota bacterium]
MTGSERTFKLTIEYDGTAYHGWQRQGRLPTVQATIERVISILIQEPVTLIGSGRTDRGVHALGQVAGFRSRTRLACSALMQGMNALLPEDIVVHSCIEVPSCFHPRHDAISKTYRYNLFNGAVRKAVGRQYAWHVHRPLDLEAMQLGLAYVVGTHDFKAFESTGSPKVHTVRTIYRADLNEEHGLIRIEFTGNGFLRCMVRNLVGTLVEIGLHRYPASEMNRMIASRDRRQAGVAAPAHGLFLVQVNY